DLLRAKRDGDGFLGRQRVRLVERVRVQALRATEYRDQRLDRHACDVVVRLLSGERDTRGLSVRPELQAVRVLRAVALLHEPGPHAARRAKFRDLFEEVVVDVEEKAEPRRERIDVE